MELSHVATTSFQLFIIAISKRAIAISRQNAVSKMNIS